MPSHGRSFTHPVLNLTGIHSNEHAANRLGSLVGSSRLPRDAFFPLIHEVTHHWFFHTPVGLALAQLQLDMAEVVAATIVEGDATADEVWSRLAASTTIEDFFGSRYLRYKAAWSMLHPILEGTACFSEFDLLPGNLDIITPPLSSVYTFYLSSPQDQSIDASALRARLASERLSEAGVDEKLNVLSQPLSGDPDSYLGAYLFTKNVWFSLMQEDSRLSDPELYLIYIRALFFNDWGVVDALLSEDADEFTHWRVISRLNELYARLTTSDPCPMIDRLLGYFGTEQGFGELTTFESLTDVASSLERIEDLTEDEDVRRAGIDRLQTSLAALVNSQVGGRRSWIIAQREAICILHEPVIVSVGADGSRIVVRMPDGNPVASFPLDEPGSMTAEADVEGHLDYYYLPMHPGYVCGVSVGGRFVASLAKSAGSSHAIEQIRNFQTDTDGMLEALSVTDRLAGDLVSDETARLYDMMDSSIEEARTKFYEENLVAQAFPFLDDNGWDGIRRDVTRAGLPGIFGTSYERARGLAFVSLLAGLPFEREFAAEQFDRLRTIHGCDGTLDDLISEIRAIAHDRLHDEELLIWDDRGFSCAV